MNYSFIIFIIIIIIILIIVNWIEINIFINDITLLYRLVFEYDYLYNNNMKYNNINEIDNDKYKNIRVLLFSFDNRKNLSYLKLHNQQLELYAKKWNNVKYEFIDKCSKNMYWCKMYFMLNRLKSNNYDYVMWLDSDAIITNLNNSIQKIFELYDSDIFIGHDNNHLVAKKTLNAGLFAVKNSKIGIEFIEECINNFEKSSCLKKKNKLYGFYAYSCYEQGTMNNLIYSKYKKYTTVLPTNIFYNTMDCDKSTYFLHNYVLKNEPRTNDDFNNDKEKKILSDIRTSEDVNNCFNTIINKNN